MTKKIYFCWEESVKGWSPVCYHGEKPKPIKVSNEDKDPRSAIVEVPADCIDADGNPMFGALVSRFPKPR